MDAAARLGSALAEKYVIDREIGAGGMATVYLARDLKHDRRVALKVLKPELGAVLGADRFLAEIKVTAHLQHPNLLPLFDSGEAAGLLYYVMPYVEGESLRHRLDRDKQLPVDTALHLATAIAGALDYAHRQGVIHRDLKPENILLHEGQPLIADFGIALAVSNAGGVRITQSGLSLGTPQYMSPEQATGDRVIDRRTDIYSLGALLYEMLTGDPAHTGSTAQAVIAQVLTVRPRSVSASRATVPAHVSAAVDRALQKLPADRFSSAQEFGDALRERPYATHEVHPDEPLTTRASRPRAMIATLGAIALGASVLAAWLLLHTPPQESALPVRFVLTLPAGMGLDNSYVPPTISPDGRSIFVRAQVGTTGSLVRRRIDELDVRPVAGTEQAALPVVSPDNQWLAYFADGQIRKAPIDGGPSIPVAHTGELRRGMAWAANETLVIGALTGPLSSVPAGGGALSLLTQLDTAQGETAHAWPLVLADGNTVVYVSWRKDGLAGARLAVTTLSSRGADSRILDAVGTNPLGVVDEHLLYVRADGVLMAVPFDVRARKTNGAPIALIAGIGVNRAVGRARAGLSHTGTLIYLAEAIQLVVRDVAGGVEQPLKAESGNFDAPRWSPDGRRIAVAVSGAGGTDIWLYDVASGVRTQFTKGGSSKTPAWTSNGERILFLSGQSGRQSVWWQRADGTGLPEKLFDAPEHAIDEAILTSDDHTLIYRARYEMFSVDLRGNRIPKPLGASGTFGTQPALSPDGKWLAFGSDGISVMPFPGPGGTTKVSMEGGSDPVWSYDGKELYYRRARDVMAVAITPGPVLRSGAPRVLFSGPYISLGGGGPTSMSVSRAGQFVLLRQVEEKSQVVVITNWFTEVRARLGTKAR